jgi:hypothetical protein
MTRKLLVGMFSIAVLAAFAGSDRTTSPDLASISSATSQRSSSDDGDKRKTCTCQVYMGHLYCYGDTCH